MQTIHTTEAPAALGPYSQAVRHGNTLYLSGQVGIIATTGKLVSDGLEAQAHQVMKNIGAVLRAAGVDYSHVVKCSIFLLDMSRFADVNAIYGSYFTAPYPARETVQVSALPAGAQIEISVVAALPSA
jgi:2-iminobutanoate/2-iminopropanoate deaminase